MRTPVARIAFLADTLILMSSQANPAFLRRAILLATKNVSSGAGGPFGAVVVRDGKIVAEGVNTVTTAHDPTAHAEVNAIRAAADQIIHKNRHDPSLSF